MKRILSLLLAVILLCTPVSALDLSEYEQAMQELKDSEFFSELFNTEELKAKTQELIDNFRTAHEDIKAMTDDELRRYIIDTAAQYHIPPMNEEQINFLMDLCRSLESAEKLGDTLKSYEEKADQMADTAKNLFATLGKLMDKLNDLLNTLTGLLDKFGISEEASVST